MRLKTSESQRRMAEMQHMRDCGFTLQQIGDQYGISRERVRQIVNNIHKKKSPCGVKNICYPNVKKWALDNGYSTLTKLANDMDKLWEYCMKPWSEHGLGMRTVLEYIGIPCE